MNQARLKHKNGHYIWFQVKGKRFIDKDGNKKLFIISRDITDLKRIEQKLTELNQLKSELIRRASHELKTPLVSVYSATDILLESSIEKFDYKTKRLLNIIKQGGDRLNLLINNLLDVSRLEEGRIKLEIQELDLILLVQGCIKEISLFAEEREINISIDSTGYYKVYADKVRFEQILINLLFNAIKYTPEKGTIFIEIIKPLEYALYIRIKDTGIGFTEEELTQVFKKFGKIERYGQGQELITEGTGLGLYISKELIELHGGTIWVESKGKNKGSTFTIKIPHIEKEF